MLHAPIEVASPATLAIDHAAEIESAYVTFAPDVRRAMRCRLRDEAAAEDIVQEAFLRLHLAVVRGGAPTSVRSWIYTVASNLATSRARHAQVGTRCLPRLHDSERGISAEELFIRHDDDRGLALALAALRPVERHALVLAAAGLTGPEIARRLDRSPLAVRALLCRARKHLRERLQAG